MTIRIIKWKTFGKEIDAEWSVKAPAEAAEIIWPNVDCQITKDAMADQIATWMARGERYDIEEYSAFDPDKIEPSSTDKGPNALEKATAEVNKATEALTAAANAGHLDGDIANFAISTLNVALEELSYTEEMTAEIARIDGLIGGKGVKDLSDILISHQAARDWVHSKNKDKEMSRAIWASLNTALDHSEEHIRNAAEKGEQPPVKEDEKPALEAVKVPPSPSKGPLKIVSHDNRYVWCAGCRSWHPYRPFYGSAKDRIDPNVHARVIEYIEHTEAQFGQRVARALATRLDDLRTAKVLTWEEHELLQSVLALVIRRT